MKITRPKILKLKELTENVQTTLELASELLKTAQDRHGHVKHKVERGGVKSEVPEKALWEEVFQLHPKAAVEATGILNKAHPEVFEAFKKQNEAAQELKAFSVRELGVDHTQMTISAYIEITEGMIALMMDEMRADIKEEIMRELIKTDNYYINGEIEVRKNGEEDTSWEPEE
jgi:hypothetical protein